MNKVKENATWIDVPYITSGNAIEASHHVCSSCHIVSSLRFPQCPHCGAKMSKR